MKISRDYPYYPFYYIQSIERAESMVHYSDRIRELISGGSKSIIFKNELQALISLKSWETKHFKMNCGVIDYLYNCSNSKTNEVVELSLDLARNMNITHLSLRIDAQQYELQSHLEKTGFNQMDGIIHFYLNLNSSNINNVQSRHQFRKATVRDAEQLVKMTSSSFTLDRFHVDEYLNQELVSTAYGDWMNNSLHGLADDVFVLVDDSDLILGYITANHFTIGTSKICKIWLFGIEMLYRGTGVAQELFRFMIDELKSRDFDFLEVGTQLRNTRAMRFYSGEGLSPGNVVFGYRKMLK